MKKQVKTLVLLFLLVLSGLGLTFIRNKHTIQKLDLRLNPITSEKNKARSNSVSSKTIEDEKKSTHSFLSQVEEEIKKQKNSNDEENNMRILAMSESIQNQNLEELKTIIFNKKLNADARFLAVHVLAKRGKDFSLLLRDIALIEDPILIAQPDPHSAEMQEKLLEVSIRMEALKGIDSIVEFHSNEAQQIFHDIAMQTKNSTMKKMALIGEVGAKQKKPLLNKYIEAKLRKVI